jgi:uncharacterized protein YbcI
MTGGDTRVLSEGQLLVEISKQVVQEFRSSVGKGPSRCRSYWAGRDLLVVLLQGGYTVGEQTLFDTGHSAPCRIPSTRSRTRWRGA